MKISAGRTDYTAVEQEVCGLHLVVDDQAIDNEFRAVKSQFIAKFPALNLDDDFEFTDWHHNIRMLWVYLYSDKFYTADLLSNIYGILETTEFKWFAQFECYSPRVENVDSQSGLVGSFFIYKESAVFCDHSGWAGILSRINAG